MASPRLLGRSAYRELVWAALPTATLRASLLCAAGPRAYTTHSTQPRLTISNSRAAALTVTKIGRAHHRAMSSFSTISAQAISELEKYTACDVSDALLKLKVPGAGFIADLTQYSPRNKQERVVVAPVSTVLFTAKDEDPTTASTRPAPNFPKDTHWVDNAVPGTFAVMQQAAGQTNAICGGIMALRMQVLGLKGIIVAGRVRDLVELQSTELPIWALGTSTVGSGGSSTPWAREVPLTINGVRVAPGDLAVHDPVNGVVVIPQDKVTQVLELLPKLTSADDKAKADVALGVSVKEAFQRHRG
ncbi:hypothetical protein ARSEF1564_003650 [Beauveria bassiana]